MNYPNKNTDGTPAEKLLPESSPFSTKKTRIEISYMSQCQPQFCGHTRVSPIISSGLMTFSKNFSKWDFKILYLKENIALHFMVKSSWDQLDKVLKLPVSEPVSCKLSKSSTQKN